MSLYNGPPRPGARGGRGEFSWDNVKTDKDREYYLGHSVKALTGRWQKNKDVYWYTRDPNQQRNMQDEIQAVKAREEQLMMEALGLRPKTQVVEHRQMDEKELADALKRSAAHEEPEDEKDKEKEGVDRVKGLGFVAGAQPAAAVMQKGYVVERMEGVGIPADGQQGRDAAAGGTGGLPPPPPQLPPPPGMGAAGSGGTSRDALLAMVAQGLVLSRAQIRELTQVDRRAGKKAKKAAKKAKKEAKKRHKEEKRAHKQQAEGSQGRHKRSRSVDTSSSSGTSSSGSDSEGEAGRGRGAANEGRQGRHDPPPHHRHAPEPQWRQNRGHPGDHRREEDKYTGRGGDRPPGAYDRDRERGRDSRDDRQQGGRGYHDAGGRDREWEYGRDRRAHERRPSRSRSRSRERDGGGAGRRQRHDTP